MPSKYFSGLAAAGFLACLSPSHLLAGAFGVLTYTNDGSSITISDCSFSATGTVTIPSTIEGKPVTAIGDFAFHGNPKVSGFSIPDSVVRIGNYAFYGCVAITSLEIPDSVTSIGDYAFFACQRLQEIFIPGSVTAIGATPFFACESLESAAIGEGARRVPDTTFQSCRSLKSIVIPGSVTEIGFRAFDGCSSLKSISIPSGVKILGDFAFARSGIRTFTMPASTTTAGVSLFEGCLSLNQVDLSPNLTEIPDRMFNGCVRLNRATLPAKVTRIGKNAFFDCNLVTITLPVRIREIGSEAFSGCENLQSAHFRGTAPAMGRKAFLGVAPDFRIFPVEGAGGYTVPKWNGYRVSPPGGEIVIYAEDGSNLENGKDLCHFESRLIGPGGVVKRFTILNVGSRKLKKLSALPHGGDSLDFDVLSLSRSSLAPGKSAILKVRFSPAERGKRTTKLWILSSDDNESPFEIELKGTGLKLFK